MVIVLALLACMPEDKVLVHYDRDGDGFMHPEAEAQGVDGPFDCDDANADIHPDATEVCDGIDNNCDSAVDDGDAAPGTFFVDADGDGFGTESTVHGCEIAAGQATQSGDCDDASDAVHPAAEEVWYDGVDQDCLDDDDHDADGDGHASDDHGGDDCRDDVPTVFEGAPEGWLDVGVDNDCDGSTDDQIVLDPGSTHRITGVGDNAGLGGAMVVLPAGWMDAEPVVVVSAGGYDAYRGAVYAWGASDIRSSASPEEATWTWIGPEPSGEYGDLLGYAVGFAGETTAPVFVMSAVGTNSGRGHVYGWVGAAIGGETSASTFVLEGDADGIYAGGVVLSDTDLDGDGTGDLVVQAILDGRVASNGGSVGVFFDPAGLSGSVSYADANTMFTISEPGSNMAPVAIGDADDNGVDDLGFEMEPLVYPKPNGVLFVGVPTSGQHEILSEGAAVLYACHPAGTSDVDGDGGAELLVLGGGVMQLDLPLSGAVYPWEAAVANSAFGTNPEHWIGQIEPDLPYWDGRRMLSASFVYDNERGAVALDVLRPGVSTDLELAKYLVLGEQPGDLLGISSALLDADSDGITDLLLGAPGFDGASAGTGAVYLIPGPR